MLHGDSPLLPAGKDVRSRRGRKLAAWAGAAILLHVALVSLVMEAPHLWPTVPGGKAPAARTPQAPTIEMVMDDNKYSGGGKAVPPPAPQKQPSPASQHPPDAIPPQPQVPADAVRVPPPETASPSSASPPAPDLRDADVDLDPSGGLGYGHQDDPHIVAARPDNKRANRMPVYPLAAGRRGEEGTVQILVMIGADGSVTGVDVATSSGHPDLDRTARDAVAHWHFRPAQQDGKAVPTQMMQVFNFRIDR
ncbi:TonB family protein [Rhizosaccharibacter radicis]|uniref:TonB family protein n=1 Tax=Rhizosaccharibacter radicis TaxID=2782605 RepID=A0ABT1VXC3_9PROT|nr:TonB family protein [Acetobacteraceae bacterium KSS12]